MVSHNNNPKLTMDIMKQIVVGNASKRYNVVGNASKRYNGIIVGIIGMMCLLPLSIAFTSCSSDDEEPENTEQNTDGRKLRQLTIAEVPITRATLTDNTSSLSAAWRAGDEATYFNLTSHTEDDLVWDFGTLSASSANATSNFTGTVRCKTGDQIALFYPATYNSKSTGPVTTSGTNRGKFTIDLSGQKGTLNDIAANYHYVYGVGEVTSVTETTASATISSMKSLLAVCKFTFTDVTFTDGSNAPIPVETLRIYYGYSDETYGYSIKGYPLTGTVNPFKEGKIVDLDRIEVAAELPTTDSPLTINFGSQATNDVYVALFPVVGQGFFFSVTNSNGTYTGKATATLKAGKFYNVTLKLTK